MTPTSLHFWKKSPKIMFVYLLVTVWREMNSFVRSWDFPIMSCKVVTYYVTTKKDKCVLRIIGTYHFTYNSPISSITVQITVLETMEKIVQSLKLMRFCRTKYSSFNSFGSTLGSENIFDISKLHFFKNIMKHHG